MTAPVSNPTMRYTRGPLEVAAYPAASGYQINEGDLCLLISGAVYAANQYTAIASWNSGAELQNWSGARSEFLGVAMGQYNSYSVVSGSVPIALVGTYQYPFPGASGTTYQPGTWVSFTQDQASGYFQAQELMQCSGQATAIGKVVEFFTPAASGAGLLTVNLQSVVVKGTIAGT